MLVSLGFQLRVLGGQRVLFRAQRIAPGQRGLRFLAERGGLFFGVGLELGDLRLERGALGEHGLVLFGDPGRTLARFEQGCAGLGCGTLRILEGGDFSGELRELGAGLAACGCGCLQLSRGFLLGLDQAGLEVFDLFANFRGRPGGIRFRESPGRLGKLRSEALALDAGGSEISGEFLVRDLEFGEGARGSARDGQLRLVFDQGVPLSDQRLDPCAVALDVGLEAAHGARFPSHFRPWRGGTFPGRFLQCGDFPGELVALGGRLPLGLVERLDFFRELLLQPREFGVAFASDGFGLTAHLAADRLDERRGFAARTIGGCGGALGLDPRLALASEFMGAFLLVALERSDAALEFFKLPLVFAPRTLAVAGHRLRAHGGRLLKFRDLLGEMCLLLKQGVAFPVERGDLFDSAVLEAVDFRAHCGEFLLPLLERKPLGVEFTPERGLLGGTALDPFEFRAQTRELLFERVAFAGGGSCILDGRFSQARLRIRLFALSIHLMEHALELTHRLVTLRDERLALLHQCGELALVLGLEPREFSRRGRVRADERLGGGEGSGR